MIKVLIVDDEPFIRQGLKIIIDWEACGYEVCAEAGNGKEAIQILEKEVIELVVVDIKMPEMDGLELIEYVQKNINPNMRFVILSGYYEFQYARQAIQYSVEDYILKPIQENELIQILQRIKEDYELKERIIYDRHLAHLLYGRYSNEDLHYVSQIIKSSSKMRYISFELEDKDENFSKLSIEEKLVLQKNCFKELKRLVFPYEEYVLCEIDKKESLFNIGMIYSVEMYQTSGLGEKEYIDALYNKLQLNFPYNLKIYIGQQVHKIDDLAESYQSVAMSRSFHSFMEYSKNICYYDDIYYKKVCRLGPQQQFIEQLINCVKDNKIEKITEIIDNIYMEIRQNMMEPQLIMTCIHYMLYRLADLARDLDNETDQEEVLQYIVEKAFKRGINVASCSQFKKFAVDFTIYLDQLRKNDSYSVLDRIEQDIQEHYMENLSLKSLGKKYYINSVYLGQLFKKQYQVSFKDYLTTLRIDKAVELLGMTNKKVYHIATEVGFNNVDYFISKFVQIKGITPHQYRVKLKDEL